MTSGHHAVALAIALHRGTRFSAAIRSLAEMTEVGHGSGSGHPSSPEPSKLGKVFDELPLVERREYQKSQSALTDEQRDIEVAFATSWIFEMGCGVVIILSVLTVAWEMDGLDAPIFLQFMESAVTSFFLLEWLVRLKVMGLRWLLDPIIIFDTFIVWVPGVLAVWAFQPLVETSSATDLLKVLRTVRMLRLLRIVLFFKHFKAFQDIFQLVRGLLSSRGTLLSALGLIAFTLYVGAIIAIDLIGHQDFTGASEDVLEAQALFQGIFPTMLTLIRFMHFDDAQPIMDSLTKRLPWIWVFLWLFTAVSAFVLLNLVTAVIVQQALEMAGSDETEKALELQKQRERDLRDLEETFKRLDEDRSGQVSLEEFSQAFKIKEIRAKMTLLGLKEREMVDLFRLLDTDGEGELSLEEFTQGMSQLKGGATNKDMVFLEKSVEKLGHKLEKWAGDPPGSPSHRWSAPRTSRFEAATGVKLQSKLKKIGRDLRGRLSRAEKEIEDVAERMYMLAKECVTLSPQSTSQELPPGIKKAPLRPKQSSGAKNRVRSKASLISEGPTVGPLESVPAEHPALLDADSGDGSSGDEEGPAMQVNHLIPSMSFLFESSAKSE